MAFSPSEESKFREKGKYLLIDQMKGRRYLERGRRPSKSLSRGERQPDPTCSKEKGGKDRGWKGKKAKKDSNSMHRKKLSF